MTNLPFVITPDAFCNVNKYHECKQYYVNNIFVVIILVELYSCNQYSFELQTFWAWILNEQTGLLVARQDSMRFRIQALTNHITVFYCTMLPES